jgi:hypothetical protein
MGLVTAVVGTIVAVTALTLGVQGWEIDRHWLYLVGSALLILVGSQLMISWLVMRILEELAERETHVHNDLMGIARMV